MQQAVVTADAGTVVPISAVHEIRTLQNIVELPKNTAGVPVTGQENSMISPELLQEPEQKSPVPHRKRAFSKEEIHVSSPKPGSSRPRTVAVSRTNSARQPSVECDIPLYLIPHVIALGIRKQGDSVFRISVKRTERHLYIIRFSTRKGKKDGEETRTGGTMGGPVVPGP